MDELKFFQILFGLLKSQGLPTVLLLIMVWDKFIKPRARKANGDWVSWKDMQKKIEQMEKIIEVQNEKAAIHDIKFATLESDHNSLRHSNDAIFEQIKYLNENFFKFMQIMLQNKNK